jgi:hypothetical protein
VEDILTPKTSRILPQKVNPCSRQEVLMQQKPIHPIKTSNS